MLNLNEKWKEVLKLENTQITVVCYGTPKTFTSREEAKDTYLDYITRCEGAERERYIHVLLQIERGLTLCTDEDWLKL